jgi:pimeloyl-ACP methyl ester carboxylesterase
VSLAHDRLHRLRNGRQLGYAEYGDPHGVPIVYCHGGLSSRLDIAFAEETCRRSGVRVLAIDRPGIGLSDRQPEQQLVDWPNDVVELADALGIVSCTVLGWSAGGPYALACARRLGSRVRRVALVGGMAPLESPAMVGELGLRIDRWLYPRASSDPTAAARILHMARRLPRRLLRALLLRELGSASDRAIVAALSIDALTEPFYEALRQDGHGIVDDYRRTGSEWGFRLQDITTEVTLWQGAEDRLLPLSHAQRLAAHLPNARFILLAHRGHFLLHRDLAHVLGTLRYR